MIALAGDILKSRTVEDESGRQFPLHSETNVEQCEFLQKIIDQVDAQTCVEIGLAYGISSLFICEALARKKSPRFISIDPHQSSWQDIGLSNLKRGEFDKFTEFHRDYSHNVLPKLLESGLKIDFAYVDTSKVFDVVLLDAIWLIRLLRVGGVVVFDDCTFPGVKRSMRYLAKMPHLAILATHGQYSSGIRKRVLSRVARMLPNAERIFRDDLLLLDETSGVNASCIAFQKTGEDLRDWKWDVTF